MSFPDGTDVTGRRILFPIFPNSFLWPDVYELELVVSAFAELYNDTAYPYVYVQLRAYL